jgi:hypothetical protein
MQKQTRLQLQNLNFADKQALISSFPNIKLCYDNVIHNKVEIRKSNNFYDVCSAIPCGKKCFAWFTQIGNKNVCLILELINKKINLGLIDRLIKSGPVIVYVDGYYPHDQLYYVHAPHFVVVIEIKDNFVIVADPYFGKFKITGQLFPKFANLNFKKLS